MKVPEKKQWNIALLGIIVVIIFFTLSNEPSENAVTQTEFLLDTFVSVTLYGEEDETLLKKPFDRIKELDEKLTAYKAGSDLLIIKENAGVKPVKVSEDTFQIIEKSLDYSRFSQGKFDVTINPLVQLWGIQIPEVRNPPDQETILKTVEKVDYTKIELDKNQGTVFLKEAGMSINLGAIAKGYIADEVMAILNDEGVEHALINLGGNVLVKGGKNRNRPFGIGVEDPNNPGQGYIGVLSMDSGSVVTSGNYERYFTDFEGRRYHHILDPDTGYPAAVGISQVTVITDRSIDSDALSTTFFLLGVDKALKLIERRDDVDAVFITDQNEIILSDGAKDLFTFDENNYKDQYTIRP